MQTVIARVSSNSSTEVIDWMGGDGTFFAKGAFTSGTLVLEASIDGGVSYQVCKDGSGVNLSLTADGIISFSVGPCKLRATMSGATVAAGTLQVETVAVTVEDVVPNTGPCPVTVTLAGAQVNRVLTYYVAPRAGKDAWVAEIYERLNANAELAPYYDVTQPAAGSIRLTAKSPALANDTALAVTLVGGGGMTTNVTSANTTAGVIATPNVLVSMQKR